MYKQTILALALSLTAAIPMNAALLTNASSDTYSYVFAGTNSNAHGTINVSQYNGSGHFTFGLIEFDVSSLSSSGPKNLLLKANAYTDGSMGATPTATGSYTLNVGVMPLDFQNYLDSPSDSGPPPPGTGKLPWYDMNILPLTTIGTMVFNDQDIASLDVTSAVNDWVTSTTNNYGFVLYSANPGSVQIQSLDFTGAGHVAPQLNTSIVPEPGAYAAIAALLAFGIAITGRRNISQNH